MTPFYNSVTIATPHLLTFDENGLHEEVYSDLASIKLLLTLYGTRLLIKSGIPCADRCWIHVKDNYIGALTFVEKPGSWQNKTAQLRYLWELLACETVVDTEIFANC